MGNTLAPPREYTPPSYIYYSWLLMYFIVILINSAFDPLNDLESNISAIIMTTVSLILLLVILGMFFYYKIYNRLNFITSFILSYVLLLIVSIIEIAYLADRTNKDMKSASIYSKLTGIPIASMMYGIFATIIITYSTYRR